MPISEDGKSYLPPGVQVSESISFWQHVLIIIVSLFTGYMIGGIVGWTAAIIFGITGGIGWMTKAPHEDIYLLIVNILGFGAGIIVAIITYRIWVRHIRKRTQPQDSLGNTEKRVL